MLSAFVRAFRTPDLRRKLLFTLGILLIFRALTNVPIPNVNTAALANLFEDNPLLGILNIFSGGGLAAASIIDRSGGTADVGVPRIALASLNVPSYSEGECPMCAAGDKPVKPGSRSA